jgi:uncharacterized protein (DUF488 family)
LKYGFSKTPLRAYLERVGIAYEHIPTLGIASAKRKNLESADDYHALFKEYAKTLRRSTQELDAVRQLLRKYRRAALTCFESVAASCHRHKITEYLQSSGGWNAPIVHIA